MQARAPGSAIRLKVAILGAGRMGQALLQRIEASRELELAGVWGRSGSNVIRQLDRLLESADVAIDFTLPDATARVLEDVTRAGKPLVCGVTGLDRDRMRQVGEAACSIPLLYDRNMSIGIAALTELVALAARTLGEAFAASVHEIHHVHKRDAPSGTALKLAEALAAARGRDIDEVYRYEAGYGSQSEGGRRAAGDIVVTAERRGEVAGEHCVRFESVAEALTLTHSVTDRRVFADGALLAAAWLVGRPAGLYSMRDVVQARGAGGGEPRSDSVN